MTESLISQGKLINNQQKNMIKVCWNYHLKSSSSGQRIFLIQIFLFLETEFLLSLSKA